MFTAQVHDVIEFIIEENNSKNNLILFLVILKKQYKYNRHSGFSDM